MSPVLIFQLLANQVMKIIVKVMSKNRFLSKFVKRATSEGLKSKAVKKGVKYKGSPLTIKSNKDIFTRIQKANEFIKGEILPKSEFDSLLSYKELLKELLFTEKQIKIAIKTGRAIKNVRKIQSIYKKVENLTNYTTGRIENKIIDLIFGKRKKGRMIKIAKDEDITSFEERLKKFSKNQQDVKEFNSIMNEDKNDINIHIGLPSSWLLWGIWTPTKDGAQYGNATLKVNPAVSRSSKNPSLIYHYGPQYGTPLMYYSVWKQMTIARAGTVYWHQYRQIWKWKT
ncbi:MAG: hypothetical protein ACRCUM_00080 [Mycoplasmoidaceae bacterium]